MLAVEAIDFGALSFCRCISTFVIWIIGWLSAVGTGVSLHGRCAFNAIIGNGTLASMFVDSDSMGLTADDTKWSCAARQEFVVFTGDESVCILISGCV